LGIDHMLTWRYKILILIIKNCLFLFDKRMLSKIRKLENLDEVINIQKRKNLFGYPFG